MCALNLAHVYSVATATVCVHACSARAAAKPQRQLSTQQTEGAMTSREGGTAAAGHTKLQLHCTYSMPLQDSRDTKGTGAGGRAGGSSETPEGPEGTRGDPRNTRRTGDARGTRRTGGNTRRDRRGPQGHDEDPTI